jgi:hypothetical protein
MIIWVHGFYRLSGKKIVAFYRLWTHGGAEIWLSFKMLKSQEMHKAWSLTHDLRLLDTNRIQTLTGFWSLNQQTERHGICCNGTIWKVLKRVWKMSGQVLKSFFSLRIRASSLNTRQLSTLKGHSGGNRTNLTKWYWLLSGTGVAVGYYALKSFRNSSQVYALQQRKVWLMWWIIIMISSNLSIFCRMNLLRKPSN